MGTAITLQQAIDKRQQDVCYKIWREEFDFGSEEDEVLSGAGLLEEKRFFHGKPIEKKCVFRDILPEKDNSIGYFRGVILAVEKTDRSV